MAGLLGRVGQGGQNIFALQERKGVRGKKGGQEYFAKY